MARIGDSCVSIGNEDWFIGDAESYDPVANIAQDQLSSLVGGSALISGEMSYTLDPEGDVLYYEWSITAPIGQDASYLGQGEDSPVLQLDTDTLGLYEVTLRVVAANGGCGNTDSVIVLATEGRDIHYGGTALDTSWIWQLLPSVWSKVDRDTRLKIELFWRGLVQLTGADLMRLYAVDVNKSIPYASERRPVRWLPIPMTFSLEDAELRAGLAEQVDVTSRQVALSPPTAVNFQGVIRAARAIEPAPGPGFTPSIADRGYSLTITLPNSVTVSTRVDDVVNIQGKVVYTLPLSAGGLQDYLSSTVSAKLTPPASPYPRAVSVEGKLALFSGTNPSLGRVNDGSGASYPYIRARGAFEHGVRAGDVLTLVVKDDLRNNQASIRLLVVSILPSESGDIIAFYPEDRSFTQLAKDVLGALFAGSDERVAEITETFNARYWLRAGAAALATSGTLTHNSGTEQFSLSYSFSHITQRSRVAVDRRIAHTTVLRETIELQNVLDERGVIATEAGTLQDLGRPLVSLVENSDYTVAQGGVTLEALSYTQGDEYISRDDGDASHDVGPADKLTIYNGFGRGQYTVTRVDEEKIYVTPRPRFSFNGAVADVLTPNAFGYLIFAQSALPFINTPPVLWAESASVDDYEELEATYGVTAGITYAQWSSLEAQGTYADVIRAIHYARMRGSTIAAMQTAVAALLGIAFINSRAIVRRIDRAYRSDESATYDKIYVERVSERGVPTESYDVLFVRSKSSASLDEKIGLVPEVEVGNILETGDVVGKGIEVIDSVAAGLTRPSARHTFDVRISAGASPLTLNGLSLAREVIDSTKPAYTDFALTPVLSVGDDVEIKSDVIFRIIRTLIDTPYGLHGPAEVLDDAREVLGRIDTRPFVVMTTWFPTDATLSYVASGEQNEYYLDSETGGLSEPPETCPFTVKINDSGALVDKTYYTRKANYDQGAWVRPGDAVVFPTLPSRAPARVLEVVSDNRLALEVTGDDYLGEHVPFVVVRYIDDLLLETTLLDSATENGVGVIRLGARVSNVGKGDIVSFPTNDPARPIIALRGDLAYLETAGYPPLSATARSAGGDVRIRRPSLAPRYGAHVEISRVNTATDALGGGPNIYTLEKSADYLGLQVGDLLGNSQVVAVMPRRHEIALRDPVDDGNYVIERAGGVEGQDALDIVEGGVRSGVALKITYAQPQVVQREGGQIALAMDVQPGDLVTLAYPRQARAVTFRVTHVTLEGVSRVVSTNLPAGTDIGGAPASATVTRQSPLRPELWR